MVDPVSPDLMRREQVLVTAEDYSKVRAQLSTATALIRRFLQDEHDGLTEAENAALIAAARAFFEAAEVKG